MPRSKERMTKKLVLSEVNHFRDKVRLYFLMSDPMLDEEYHKEFNEGTSDKDRNEMLKSLILKATYDLTNVLNLE